MITGSITRGITTLGGGLKLPLVNRLFYSRLPTSENYVWDEEAMWGDSFPWGVWALPADLFDDLGEGTFFTAGGVPIDVTGAELLVDPTVNIDHILFSVDKGLAIYVPNSSLLILNKAYKYFSLTFTPEAHDGSWNQLTDASGNLLTTIGF